MAHDVPGLSLEAVARSTGATRVARGARIQSLWSGYGELFRVTLEGAEAASAVAKWVKPPARPRDDASHARKCRSYDVETRWYRSFAARCDETCRVPALLGATQWRGGGGEQEWLLLLEDLDAAGYAGRRHHLSSAETDLCLGWLASYHARFLGVQPEGLWPVGTYWHLGTRKSELPAIEDTSLREAAPLLDRKLREAKFQTLVHGDAKPANFCFAPRGRASVAAVDFQYVGGGCGMKDVAYLLADPSGSEATETRHLEHYFRELTRELDRHGAAAHAAALEQEWRELYPIARADYYRFLAGWASDHYRRDRYAQGLVREVLRILA